MAASHSLILAKHKEEPSLIYQSYPSPESDQFSLSANADCPLVDDIDWDILMVDPTDGGVEDLGLHHINRYLTIDIENNQEIAMETNLVQDDQAYVSDYKNFIEPNQLSKSWPFSCRLDDINCTTPRPRLFQGFSSLTPEEELALRKIAMPSEEPSAFYNNKRTVIQDSSTDADSSGSLTRRPSRKRPMLESIPSFGSSSTGDGVNITVAGESDAEDGHTGVGNAKKRRKQDHNAIEKRYRSSLNDKITSLDLCLPALTDDSVTGSGNSIQPRKITKSAILSRAAKHIQTLESNTKSLTSEVEAMHMRIVAFEQLACGQTFEGNPRSD